MAAEIPQTPEGDGPASAVATVERSLRRATAADVQALATVLADAFLDDPIYSWLIPMEQSRHARLRRFFALHLRIFGLDRGIARTTTDLAGAAISTPPGNWRLPTSAAVRNFRRYGAVFGQHGARAFAYLLRLERQHVRGPHHYIAAVGVAPAAQGQGLGTRLLRPTLEVCDSEGLPAYIEASSERNARLYERLGFVITSEMRFRDSPPLRLMLRAPASG